MIKVSVGLVSIESALGSDFGAVLDVARMADAKGVDLIHVSDHVAIGPIDPSEKDQLLFPVGAPWLEPITILAAIAAVTKRIRVSANILIGPLRPAVLLAKQLATLDHVAGGRAEIGLGAGWHKAEFDACGMAFESRFSYLEEQINVCRLLWREAPASFEGKHVRFKDLYVLPQPIQETGLPIWLGVGATPKGCARIAEFADGWFVNTSEVPLIAQRVQRIREAYAARGRDPASLKVHAELHPITGSDGKADFDAMFATVPALMEAGATTVSVTPGRYCRGFNEIETLIDRLVALKNSALPSCEPGKVRIPTAC